MGMTFEDVAERIVNELAKEGLIPPRNSVVIPLAAGVCRVLKSLGLTQLGSLEYKRDLTGPQGPKGVNMAKKDPPPRLLFDLPFYTREQVAALSGLSLGTIKKRIVSGNLAYDKTILGRRCFSRQAALIFLAQENKGQ